MGDVDRGWVRDSILGAALGFALMLLGGLLMDDTWGAGVWGAGAAFTLEAAVRAWRGYQSSSSR